MGYKSWSEEVEEQVGVDNDGNPVTIKRKVRYYEITCDYCGKVIMNSKTGEGLGSAYYQKGDKYYHPQCWDVVNAGQ